MRAILQRGVLGLTLVLAIGAIATVAAQDTAMETTVYVAEIQPVNEGLADSNAHGLVTLVRTGDMVFITAFVAGMPPGMMHLMHLHGFPEGDRAGTCPTPDADTNDDDLIDITEAYDVAGQTLIPFNEAPSDLEIFVETYPNADDLGIMTYQASVPLEDLLEAVGETHGIDDLVLDELTVMVHSVPEDVNLPETVESLPDAPARLTVPLGCGEVRAL